MRADVITALMFGVSHGVLQQSIAATLMGLLLGWIALRTGSVLPGMLVHFTNNALSVSMERIAESNWEGSVLFLTASQSGPAYQPMWIVTSIGIAITCMLYFGTLRPRFDESEADLIDVGHNLIDPAASLATA